jgi:broad specificity phosphatase PhoE
VSVARSAQSGVARRRIYLMRHAQVRYFEGLDPEQVVLTEEGQRQAGAASAALERIRFDRVVTSGLTRTLETAGIVAPGIEPEASYGLREIESGEIRGLAPEAAQEMMATAFRGVVPLETRFLGGESIAELFERALPELDGLLADETWDVLLLVLHGGVNRAIISHALTGNRIFLGGFEQSPGCINVLDVAADGSWIVRAVNHTAYDPAHVDAPRATTMEHLWDEYTAARERRASA